ncbi:enoyl-CoA hydratase-related protein [Pseudomonas sp. S3_G06]
MTEAILLERERGLLTLRLNRPDKKNALTRAMYSRLAEALKQANDDPQINAVLISGSAECFTAGNDIADFLEQPPSDLDSPVFHFMLNLLECRKPVIAAVAGAAVGIGTTMLLHCDLVYVSRDARLRMPFVNLGLCPEFGSSLILPRLLGQAKAAELLLLGEGFNGEQAVQWGIATQALDSGEAALSKAREVALRFDELPAEAVRISKQLMRAPDRDLVRKVIEEEGALFTQRLRSPEAVAALSEFFGEGQDAFASRLAPTGERISKLGASLLAKGVDQTIKLSIRGSR